MRAHGAIAATLFCVLFITGCGLEREALQSSAVAAMPAERLEGNWLIYGSLPRIDVPAVGPNQTQGLALSLSSVGKTLTGAAFLSGTCTTGEPFLIIFGNAITATPDAAGDFVTSSTQVFGWGFTLTGTAPNVAGRPWSGTYQLTNQGTSNTCAFSGSGTFTATPVGQLTGTFVGSGSVGTFAGSGVGALPGASIGVDAALVQGMMLPGPNGTTTYNSQSLQGTVQISGIPCFTHGVPSTLFGGGLYGNEFLVDFTMDDGSKVEMVGTIDNTLTTHLLLNDLSVVGGKCSGNYGFAVPGAELSR